MGSCSKPTTVLLSDLQTQFLVMHNRPIFLKVRKESTGFFGIDGLQQPVL